MFPMDSSDKKRSFIVELPSKDAIKLANAIYNTYIFEGKNPYLSLSVKRLCDMYNMFDDEDSHAYIRELFEELNEPAVVENFKYRGHIIDWKVISFCEFEHVWKDDDPYIEVNLNEMYLAAMAELMDEPFLPLKKK